MELLKERIYMDDQTPKVPQKQPGGYGKRPIWQWVVLYLVVGAIVYGIIYYFFMSQAAGNGY